MRLNDCPPLTTWHIWQDYFRKHQCGLHVIPSFRAFSRYSMRWHCTLVRKPDCVTGKTYWRFCSLWSLSTYTQVSDLYCWSFNQYGRMRWGSGNSHGNRSYSCGGSVTQSVLGGDWASAHVSSTLCLLVFSFVLGSVTCQSQTAVTIFFSFPSPGTWAWEPCMPVKPSATELYPQPHFLCHWAMSPASFSLSATELYPQPHFLKSPVLSWENRTFQHRE